MAHNRQTKTKQKKKTVKIPTRNIDESSSTYGPSRILLIKIYSECESETLVNQHIMRIRPNILLSLACLTLPHFVPVYPINHILRKICVS